MLKPRVIIADTNYDYIIPLQLKFIEEFYEKIELEIITDKDYYNELFSNPQKADILIVAENLYDLSLQRHDINNIFLMTEQYDEEGHTVNLKVNRIYKYTSVKEILNEIKSKSAEVLNLSIDEKKETQIVLVHSANGGVGKTTLSMGMCACLTKNYKRVLYINACRLQFFQRMLENQSSISGSDVYSNLVNPNENTYKDIKHVIRKEFFYYLPPFKAALMSLGLKYSLYAKIIMGAKTSADYDYIIVDTDTSFDEEKVKLYDIADKVIIVTRQNSASVYATNILVSNMNRSNSDKYIFVCNDFDEERDNALISPNMTMRFSVSNYVEHIEHYDQLKAVDLSKISSIKKTAFLIF